MLDVHPPHEAAHSWKDFFVHIATIVVGLIIAVGLEQTVEAWRHHRAASELREQLHGESEQILFDARRVDVGLGVQQDWLARRTDAVASLEEATDGAGRTAVHTLLHIAGHTDLALRQVCR